MWAVLQYRQGDFFKTFEGFVAKRVHGKVDFAFVVVPVKVDHDIFVASVIDRDIIMFFRMLMRWLASSCEVYLTPKLSTPRVDWIG